LFSTRKSFFGRIEILDKGSDDRSCLYTLGQNINAASLCFWDCKLQRKWHPFTEFYLQLQSC